LSHSNPESRITQQESLSGPGCQTCPLLATGARADGSDDRPKCHKLRKLFCWNGLATRELMWNPGRFLAFRTERARCRLDRPLSGSRHSGERGLGMRSPRPFQSFAIHVDEHDGCGSPHRQLSGHQGSWAALRHNGLAGSSGGCAGHPWRRAERSHLTAPLRVSRRSVAITC
jgi:hypothetical protein